jgi:hypothetical protein
MLGDPFERTGGLFASYDYNGVLQLLFCVGNGQLTCALTVADNALSDTHSAQSRHSPNDTMMGVQSGTEVGRWSIHDHQSGGVRFVKTCLSLPRLGGRCYSRFRSFKEDEPALQ